MQTGQITVLMADTVLVAQHHIQELKMAVNGRNQPMEITDIRTESVRIAHMFNRITTLIWNCLTVCGLKAFIVRFASLITYFDLFCDNWQIHHNFDIFFFFLQQLDWFDGPYFNHLLQQFEISETVYSDSIEHIDKYRIYVNHGIP